MGERRERSPAKRERSPAIKKDRSPIKRGERERSPLKKGDLKSPIKRGERSPGKRDRSVDDLKKEGRERSVGQVTLIIHQAELFWLKYIHRPLETRHAICHED